jgi:hypothetical protein
MKDRHVAIFEGEERDLYNGNGGIESPLQWHPKTKQCAYCIMDLFL